MICYDEFSELLEAFPWLDDFVSYPHSHKANKKYKDFIKNSHFDTIFDLQNNFRSRKFCRKLSPERIVRFHRSRLKRWLLINAPSIWKRLNKPAQVPIEYLKTASPFNIRDDGEGLKITLSNNWNDSVKPVISEFSKSLNHVGEDQVLVFAPGARHQTKIWPAHKWVELLELAQRKGFPNQILVGGENDRAFCEQIAKQVDHPVLVLAGKTSLGELCAVIGSGDVLITEDSAPMHIAAAMGTPVVAIFGPTVPEFGFEPFRVRRAIISDYSLNCRPCHPHGSSKCPRYHFQCMLNINAEKVFSGIREVLEPQMVKVDA